MLGPNQVCTLFGASPGSTQVPGAAYLSVGYGLEVVDLWRRNFTVLLGFFILFQILTHGGNKPVMDKSLKGLPLH